MDPDRPRRDRGGRRHRADLPDAVGGAGPLHPERLGGAHRGRVDDGAAREGAGGPPSAAGDRSGHPHGGTGRGAEPVGAVLRRRARAGPRTDGGRVGRRPRVSRRRPRRRARRSRDDHLHVGDDRRAEGRDAHARIPRRQHDGGRRGARRARGRRRAVVPAAQPRLRADGLLRLPAARRHDDLRRVARDHRPRRAAS